MQVWVWKSGPSKFSFQWLCRGAGSLFGQDGYGMLWKIGFDHGKSTMTGDSIVNMFYFCWEPLSKSMPHEASSIPFLILYRELFGLCLKIELIGLSENLRETSIFYGTIHSFLQIFPYTNPLKDGGCFPRWMCSSGTNQRDSGSEVCLGFVVEKLLDIMDVHTPEIEHQHGCGLKPWYPDGTRMVPQLMAGIAGWLFPHMAISQVF